MLAEILNDLKLTRRDAVVFSIIMALALAWSLFICYTQALSFDQYQRDMQSWYENTIQVGDSRVDKDSYERAVEQWRAEHPEPSINE